MGVENAYADIRVLELGTRLAAGGCGSFLSQTGASVVHVDIAGWRSDITTKHDHRAGFAAGKSSARIDFETPKDCKDLQAWLSQFDVVITSHDSDPDWSRVFGNGWQTDKIVCDISAFGRSGPLAGTPYSDFQIQALSGLIDTTGDPGKPANRIALPVTECLAALHAFGGIGAALHALRKNGVAQNVEVALYDCAFAASASFLPKYIVDGQVPRRLGNRHPTALPWNVYRARDEWVLICTSSNEHWRRLAGILDDPKLIDDEELKTAAGRIKRVDELDEVIAAWVALRPANECVKLISELSIPCATIAPLTGHPIEPNLDFRGQICKLHDPVNGHDVFVPGPVIRTLGDAGRPPLQIPDIDECLTSDKPANRAKPPTGHPAQHPGPGLSPFAGLRVIEVGSLTTGPLCGRMLASLGAEVIKVEPPTGDPMRHMPPLQNDQGYFFSYYNTDKKSVAIDLKAPSDRERLATLLKDADVLIQNLKEGAFARMGFTRDYLAELNPALVRCDISGFGQTSIYDGRPAVDSIVQAVSGIMTANQAGTVPMKTGISFVDLQVAVLSFGATVAALYRRDETGRGIDVDLAMQDIANWSTQTFWNGAELPPISSVIECNDGNVITLASPANCLRTLNDCSDGDGTEADLRFDGPMATAITALLSGAGIESAQLCSVANALHHEQTTQRALHYALNDTVGETWPAVRVPIGLSQTPPTSNSVIGSLGADNDDVFGMATHREASSS